MYFEAAWLDLRHALRTMRQIPVFVGAAVVGQVALSVVLSIGAALLVKAVARLNERQPGISGSKLA